MYRFSASSPVVKCLKSNNLGKWLWYVEGMAMGAREKREKHFVRFSIYS